MAHLKTLSSNSHRWQPFFKSFKNSPTNINQEQATSKPQELPLQHSLPAL